MFEIMSTLETGVLPIDLQNQNGTVDLFAAAETQPVWVNGSVQDLVMPNETTPPPPPK